MTSYEPDAHKVLIADDDAATRILLRSVLTHWGYRVVEAENGEEAWNILQQPDPPSILTLDWIMPKLDGLSLCKRIDQELDQRPYIIFLTRMTDTEYVIQGLEAGADEFMLKPFDPAELHVRIFAGERIIQYRRHIAELQSLLQETNELLSTIHQSLSVNESFRHLLTTIETLQNKMAAFTINAVKQQPLNALQKISSKNSAPHINQERMRAFFGDDANAIREFIETFITLASEQLEQILMAIEHRDTKTAKYYFHLLGSASGNSGMMEMYELCGKGEKSVMKNNWHMAEECHRELMKIMGELRVENQT